MVSFPQVSPPKPCATCPAHNDNNTTNNNNNKPDIIIRYNKQGTFMLIDVGISGDRNVITKEAEKIVKYKDLIIDFHRMWNLKAKVMPIRLEPSSPRFFPRQCLSTSAPYSFYYSSYSLAGQAGRQSCQPSKKATRFRT